MKVKYLGQYTKKQTMMEFVGVHAVCLMAPPGVIGWQPPPTRQTGRQQQQTMISSPSLRREVVTRSVACMIFKQ